MGVPCVVQNTECTRQGGTESNQFCEMCLCSEANMSSLSYRIPRFS
jgi:hypothetical protein